jgi:tetratricopeptide (TPR) repeat protein
MKKINYIFTILCVLAIGYSSAQKTNITDAAVLMKKYNPMGGEKSSKLVNEAKDFIDKAAVHPETSESMKMHYYRGMIYFALIEMATIDAMSGKTQDDALMEQYAETSKESFLKVVNDTDKRKGYQEDAKSFIDMRVKQYWDMGIGMYETKNYELAMMGFMGAYSVSEFIGVDYEDAKVNAMAMFNVVTDSLLNSGQLEKTEELAILAQEAFGKEMTILTTLINVALKQGDKTKSEKYINQALELDPENKELYYILGTSYIELKENKKAEENLLKAIEIDSMYVNAHSNLAALYMSWSPKSQ